MSYGSIPHRERRNIRVFFTDNTAARLNVIMLQIDAMRAENGQQTQAKGAASQAGNPLQIGQSEAKP